jgi:3-hydroxy-5-phosphonooxypentane-2,4-dione thiolase
MPDDLDLTDGSRFAVSVPARHEPFGLRGCGALDWGMQSRLARVFRPATGRTVMLAIDHGYFQGPTSGLERVDLSIVPLLPYADALMTTRGMVRSTIPPASAPPIVLRASGGPSVLRDLSDEQIAVGMETAVGRELTRDARYLRLATRICAELGAHMVKTYYCEPDFDTVAAACPVPLVMAGGKKLPERDALTMAYRAIESGAAGVDMGRNIFQSEAPQAMIRAVGAVVHESMKPEDAYDQYVPAAAGGRAGRAPAPAG